MTDTQTKLAGEQTQRGKPMPMLWTSDAKRIAHLFCRFDSDKNTITVHTPITEIVADVHPTVMDVCGYVGMHLAGKPVGDTAEIITALKLWKG